MSLFNFTISGQVNLQPIAAPPFAPGDIAGLHRYEAANYNALTGAWTDSGNLTAANCSQGTALNRPLSVPSIINGFSVVRFDGSDDFLSVAIASTALQTVFAVLKSSNPTASYQRLLEGNTDGGNVDLSSNTSTAGAGIYSGSYFSRAFDTGSFFVLATLFNGASSAIFKDGVQQGATGNVGSGTSASFRIGRGNTNGEPLAGDLAELLIYNTALSDADRQSVETFLGTKYGIAITH